MLNEALNPPGNQNRRRSQEHHEKHNIKRIATSSLALVLLHGNSFARLAIGIHLAARTASAVAAQKTSPASGAR